MFAGTVYALTADSDGTLYAGGGFSNLESVAAADNVAYLPSGGTWQPMDAGAGACGCAVTTFVRGLTAVGTDVYVGTDANGHPAGRSRREVTPPATSLRRAQINQARRRATFRFASGEPGSTFSCKLDKKKLRPCTSPKSYRKLGPGKHVFRVKARDRAGNLDTTPAVKRFRIKKR